MTDRRWESKEPFNSKGRGKKGGTLLPVAKKKKGGTKQGAKGGNFPKLRVERGGGEGGLHSYRKGGLCRPQK